MENKPNIKFSGIKKMLTREQMKGVTGGYGGYSGSGSCYQCTCGSMTSCWYFSGGNPNFGCARVYTGSCSTFSSMQIPCSAGCHT